MSHQHSAEEFLKHAHLYKLGDLQTEARHPLTMDLANWANNDLPQAIRALVAVDSEALARFKAYLPEVAVLRDAVQAQLKSGGRVFLCGCGATGRLSLFLESLWRELNPGNDQVIAFMAGGDVALVHSIEGFEDFPERGARHLRELGFNENDILLAITEGGETPFVIGALHESLRLGAKAPWFLYCNPDEILCRIAERSKAVIQNPEIKKLNLTVGPMGISGSTRMQASTVLQLAVGIAIFPELDGRRVERDLAAVNEVENQNAGPLLTEFVRAESEVYRSGDYILYNLADHFITVFTDTTERAPTFSLTPFSHRKAEALLKRPPSLSYVQIRGAKTAAAAWKLLLGRAPRPLDWIDIDPRTGKDYLETFDFGDGAYDFRQGIIGKHEQEAFMVQFTNGRFQMSLTSVQRELEVPAEMHPLFRHTLLKMLFNIHSTLVMGRIGRFEKNVMTYVYPTNGKLVDRASRYVLALLDDEVRSRVSYEDVVRELFKQFADLPAFESVVLRTAKHFAGASFA